MTTNINMLRNLYNKVLTTFHHIKTFKIVNTIFRNVKVGEICYAHDVIYTFQLFVQVSVKFFVRFQNSTSIFKNLGEKSKLTIQICLNPSSFIINLKDNFSFQIKI